MARGEMTSPMAGGLVALKRDEMKTRFRRRPSWSGLL
jgi:hypothetical protein